VLRNPNKTPLFTVQERRPNRLIGTSTHLEVDSFDGLTVNYAQMRQAQVFAGFTGASDFAELQMAHTNKKRFLLKLKPFFWRPQTSIVFK